MNNLSRGFTVIPAVDVMAGRCVRLRRGVFNDCSVYDRSPRQVAEGYAAAGFSRLHVVDLDGARDVSKGQFELVKEICANTDCRVDVGGGIRSLDQVGRYLDAGAEMVCVSTMAVCDRKSLAAGISRFGAGRFIVGADVRNGRIAISGWREESREGLFSFIGRMEALGIRQVLCTDVQRDGMMCGPAVELYREILRYFPLTRLLASGGVHSLEQVEMLKQAGLSGVVVGRALVEGKMDVEKLTAVNQRRGNNAGKTNNTLS